MELRKLNCGEVVIGAVGLTVGDFWSWAYSDILSNANRSVFAEFLVASALGVTNTPRVEWDGVDLRYVGKRLEVKCSAFLQSWPQRSLSLIRFDIAKKIGWDAKTNTSAAEALRSADCYVFSLYSEKDHGVANVLNVHAWTFYVMSTIEISSRFGEQKSITLSRLLPVCDPVSFEQLKERVDKVLGV